MTFLWKVHCISSRIKPLKQKNHRVAISVPRNHSWFLSQLYLYSINNWNYTFGEAQQLCREDSCKSSFKKVRRILEKQRKNLQNGNKKRQNYQADYTEETQVGYFSMENFVQRKIDNFCWIRQKYQQNQEIGNTIMGNSGLNLETQLYSAYSK